MPSDIEQRREDVKCAHSYCDIGRDTNESRRQALVEADKATLLIDQPTCAHNCRST